MNSDSCQQCGAARPEGVLLGLCPRCLARQAGNILAARDAAARAPAPVALRYFGDYELLEEIARGGMGVVWKARQASLNRAVAVKLLLAGKFSTPEVVQRFRAEAEAAANLQHPNIVAIHEIGEHEGQQYFSMEYVEGPNFSRAISDSRLTIYDFPRTARLMRQICEAIHYAHGRGVLHRDLKPSNVLLDPQGQPRVTDFGLAKRLNSETESSHPESERDLTLTGQVLGTPAYMPPEQAGGRKGEVGVRSDVYSLGALLYFLLTGRAPFVGNSLEETLRQVHEMEPVSPRLLNPAVPRDLETICLKCLEKEPARRYASARALAEELDRFLQDEPIHARPAGPAEKLWRWGRRKPALAALVVALLFVGAAGLGGILWQWSRAERSADAARLAQLETTTNLWQSYLAQARANRYSGRLGRRFDSLDTLAKAAAIRPSSELRDEAIAALMLPDLRLLRHGRTNEPPWSSSVPDATLTRYALGHTNGQVTVHRIVDDAELLRLPAAESDRVRVIAFSPAGRYLAVFHSPATLRVWDLESRAVALTNRCLNSEGGHSLDFSPDDRSLALLDGSERVIIRDLAGGAQRLFATPCRLEAVRYSPDGRTLGLTSHDVCAVNFLDADSGRILARHPFPHGVGVLAWHRDGNLVATAIPGHQIQVWDWRTGEVLRTFPGHGEMTYSWAFHPKCDLLFSCGWDGIRIWDTRTGEQLPRVPGPAKTPHFQPGGARLLATHPTRGEFRLFEVALDDPVARFDPADDAQAATGWCAVFSPDGALLLNTSEPGTLHVHDARSGRTLAKVETGQIKGMAFDAGTNLWTSGERGLRRWPLRPGSGPAQWTLGPPEAVGEAGARDTLAISGDGRTLVNVEGTRCHWFETRTQTFRGMLASGKWEWNFAALSPDGSTLATASWSTRGVVLWETQTGRRLRVLGREEFRQPSGATAFSPDGQWLAVCIKEEISAWRTRDWTQAWHFPREDHGGSPVISPDSRLLAARCDKSDLRLLALESGEVLARLELPTGEPHATPCFSPDGMRLALRGVLTRRLFVVDLHSLRARLAEMDLDWNLPPHPPAGASAPPPAKLEVTIAPGGRPY